MLLGSWTNAVRSRFLNAVILLFAIATTFTSIMCYLVPYDSNAAAWYPEISAQLRSALNLGLLE